MNERDPGNGKRMAKEAESGGVEQEGDNKVNENKIVAKPYPHLVDLTY